MAVVHGVIVLRMYLNKAEISGLLGPLRAWQCLHSVAKPGAGKR